MSLFLFLLDVAFFRNLLANASATTVLAFLLTPLFKPSLKPLKARVFTFPLFFYTFKGTDECFSSDVFHIFLKSLHPLSSSLTVRAERVTRQTTSSLSVRVEGEMSLTSSSLTVGVEHVTSQSTSILIKHETSKTSSPHVESFFS